jgi:glyoxylase-like metal-dependent hydrolase (beta-lactamase superfamily II)
MTFGYTPLSCSIQPDETTGFILWINGRGALVDPPLFTSFYFDKFKIPINLIDWVILTHAHSDSDIGILQRLVESSRM